MAPTDVEFFRANGYVSLGRLLDDRELAHFQDVYDRDRERFADHWYRFGHWQTINCDALFTSPEFDGLVRHPAVMPALHALMSDTVCFSEICIRHMTAYDGPLDRGWHRDHAHWPEHPLRIDHMQLMVYLTDVDETTHCFSLSPESADDDHHPEEEAQLARGGIVDIHGPAGTGVLFNVSVLHTATTRPTTAERKTVQVYYGHPSRKYLSEDSLMPPALWRDHPDAGVREFYGVHNAKTREYVDRVGAGPISMSDSLALLRTLDVEFGRRQ